jgi:hypothetical protein
MFRRLKKLTVHLFFLTATGALLCAKSGAAEDLYWAIGDSKLFIGGDVPALTVALDRPHAPLTLDYLLKVGSIAFHSTAKPDRELKEADPHLAYVHDAPDGSRFQLASNRGVLTLRGYDWQLVPLVKYVDSDYTALLSLFGPGPERDRNYYIQYHPAIKNTLLGLRLLQSDIVFMNPVGLRMLPRFENKTILGKGELEPDGAKSFIAAKELESIMRDVDAESWTLLDGAETPAFSAENNSIVLQGRPHYYFWSYSTSRQRKEFSKTLESVVRALAREGAGEKQIKERIRQEVSKFEALMQGKKDEPVAATASINQIDENWPLLMEYNRPVFEAVLLTYRYIPLLRYMKNRPTADYWRILTSQINHLDIIPNVLTPTQRPKDTD